MWTMTSSSTVTFTPQPPWQLLQVVYTTLRSLIVSLHHVDRCQLVSGCLGNKRPVETNFQHAVLQCKGAYCVADDGDHEQWPGKLSGKKTDDRDRQRYGDAQENDAYPEESRYPPRDQLSYRLPRGYRLVGCADQVGRDQQGIQYHCSTGCLL